MSIPDSNFMCTVPDNYGAYVEFKSEEDLKKYIIDGLDRLEPVGSAFLSDRGKQICIAFNAIDGSGQVWFSCATKNAKNLNGTQKFRMLISALELHTVWINSGDSVPGNIVHRALVNQVQSRIDSWKCLIDLYSQDQNFRIKLDTLFSRVKTEFTQLYDSGHHRTVINECKKQESIAAFKKHANACINLGVEYETLKDELDKLLVKCVDGA